MISVNVLGSICLCPDLHCFLWLRKWTRLKLNISKLGGCNIFPSISSLPQSAWALTVFKKKIFLQMEGKKWFSDYWVSRPTKKDFSNLEIEKKIFWLVFSSYIFHRNFTKFSIHWIFAQKNGLFLCGKHCEKVLIKYSWIFSLVDNFL